MTGQKSALHDQLMTTHLERLLSQWFAVHPPLRLEDGLDDIPRLAADRDLHRVVLRLDI